MKSQLLLVFLVIFGIGWRIAAAETKTEYLQKRNVFIQNEKAQQIGGKLKLTAAESKVNQFLMKLKMAEILGDKDNDTMFPPEHHFFHAKPVIDKSPIFKLLRKMPKGGALHVHDSAMASVDWLIKRATYNPNCYMCLDGEQLLFKFFSKRPGTLNGCSWQQVITARKKSGNTTKFDSKLRQAMMMNVPDPHTAFKTQNEAWRHFRSLFAASGGLFTYAPVFRDYFQRALEEFYEDNVQYIEVRVLLLPTYELDGTVHDQDWAMDTYLKTLKQFKKSHPDFIGVKLIFTSIRSLATSVISADITTSIRFMKKYPTLFAGYDLVEQEDTGHTLMYYLDELLIPRQNGHDLKYFFHAGETDWQDIGVDENLIDAILLNTSRIGHAYAITKHPAVMKAVKTRGIGLEINPISNQVLMLVADLRNHPAATLLANDFPLVISSDDPALWGATPLSHDFYEAFLGIGGAWADLRTLKKLVMNSFIYSAMNTEEKSQAVKLWSLKWQEFISSTIQQYHL